jgi:predicted RNA binding protein YcfA (HicA-like mRNA interferase family)
MPKLAVITPKQLIKLLTKIGFTQRDAEGSHVLFRHTDGRTTTVAVKSKEVSRGLLRKTLRDIDVTRDEYEALRREL